MHPQHDVTQEAEEQVALEETAPVGAPVSYREARAELLGRPGPVGSARRAALVALTDDWLAQLVRDARGEAAGVALVAVGGYGRRELSPGSDLDLLLLHPPGVDVAALADNIWYPIWDAGVRLDHSVRTVAEARRAAADDVKVVLGLLDARTVAGDPALAEAMRASALGDWRGLAARRLPALREEARERAERSGELAHLLEPDLKESSGGLRDVTVLRAVAASWVTDIPHDAVAAAATTLLDVRDALHLSTGRPSDRLLLQEQAAVAALVGEADDDALLRSVSAAGRAVAHAADTTWHRVDRIARSRSLVRRLRRSRDREPLADGVVVQDDEVVLALEARPERDPVLLLRTAAAAAQAGLRPAPHAVERLVTASAPLPVPWPPEARDALVSLLGAGRAALPVWEAFDQADAWTHLIPEWGVVRSAPQRNPVHTFSVDRHLVEAAARAAAYTRRVDRPDLLLVGALLHDIGKGRPGDHTQVGIGLVGEIAPRWGFDDADSAVLVDLVRYHLLLPEVATRRDLEDPATVDQVVAAVREPRLLDLLHALTEADALATGPAAWSDWKKSLVDDLVRRARAAMAGTAPDASPNLTPEQRALAAADDPSEVLVTVDHGGTLPTICVAAPDRVGMLATVAGVLSVLRLDVRAARTETIGGRAVTVWQVAPSFGAAPPAERIREEVRRALEGSLDVEAALARRESAYQGRRAPEPAPPSVDVVPGASGRATVIEVRAHDVPGLLHRVGRALAAADVSITAARVATLGSEVVDVFYVVDRLGQPLSDGHAGAARATVLAALGPTP